MAGHDFFDEDLVQERDGVKRIRMGPGDEPAKIASQEHKEGFGVPVSDLNLTQMVKKKEEVAEDLASKARQLERLKQMQEEIEHQKRDLEDIRRKQSEYERGKKEMLERLMQSLIHIEKQEVKAAQLTELLSSTRKQFKEMLKELESINEDNWPEKAFREELGKALVLVDDARMEFNKIMARIETLNTSSERVESAEHQPVIFEESYERSAESRGFGHWLKIGLAVSLPLALILLVLFSALVFLLSRSGFIM